MRPLLTLGSFMKTTETSQIYGLLFSMVNAMHKFIQTIYWATFWAIFSQTHLVTLKMAQPIFS
jgi:hypothetical protein